MYPPHCPWLPRRHHRRAVHNLQVDGSGVDTRHFQAQGKIESTCKSPTLAAAPPPTAPAAAASLFLLSSL
jgi:hypothetical protein